MKTFKFSKQEIEKILDLNYQAQKKFSDSIVMTHFDTEETITFEAELGNDLFIEGRNNQLKIKFQIFEQIVVKKENGNFCFPSRLFEKLQHFSYISKFQDDATRDEDGSISQKGRPVNVSHVYTCNIGNNLSQATEIVWELLQQVFLAEENIKTLRFYIDVGKFDKDYLGNEIFVDTYTPDEIETALSVQLSDPEEPEPEAKSFSFPWSKLFWILLILGTIVFLYLYR